jgi:cytochrome c oxidase assembly protein subunit 15
MSSVGTTSCASASLQPVRLWLLLVAALIFVTLVVGGATRLTGSGLSIVEWRPVTGVVPPMDESTWQAEFDKYKVIPQYREHNPTMTLDEFKVIYWWEWTHRTLARLAGAAFLLPFLWFLWRNRINQRLRVRLWTIFALGAALGAIGWWMVASGLSERVSVSQYRLAFHLTLACIVFAAVVWTAQRLAPGPAANTAMRLRVSAIALVVLVLAQIYLGALVAGLHAGLLFNTWPLIDGALLPDARNLFFDAPLWRNFFENALTVQFDHRVAAYALCLLAWLHALDAASSQWQGRALTGAVLLAVAMTLQSALGIVTLLYQVPLTLALSHQALAIAVLTLAVVHAERLTRRTKKATAEAAPVAARREQAA